jgi:hypothetical protein
MNWMTEVSKRLLDPGGFGGQPVREGTESTYGQHWRSFFIKLRGGRVVVAVACATPAGLMLQAVIEAPDMHYLDYWDILGRAVREDGGLSLEGVFTLQNGHPTWLPALVYYLFAFFMRGTNTELALLAWILAGATLALLVRQLPMQLLGPVRFAAAAALSSWLIFSPKGLHNFAYGMSGVAWWSAAVASVAAMHFAVKGRWLAAFVSGLAACACYGTGFAVWPALSVIALLRGSKLARAVLPLLLGAVMLVAWRLAKPAVPATVVDTAPADRLQAFTSTIGGIWFSQAPEMAAALGAVVVIAGVAAFWSWVGHAYFVKTKLTEDAIVGVPAHCVAFWAGLFTWGTIAAALISVSRAGLGAGGGLSSRYTSVAALTVIAAALLCLLVFRMTSDGLWVAASAVAAAVTLANATGVGQSIRGTYDYIRLSAVAARLDAPQAVPEAPVPERYVRRLRNLGGYPFGETFDLNCANWRLGDRFDSSRLPELPSGVATDVTRGTIDSEDNLSGLRIAGWAAIEDQAPGCLLAVADGEVVGGGVVGLPRPDVAQLTSVSAEHTGWIAVAPRGITVVDVVFFVGQRPAYRLRVGS